MRLGIRLGLVIFLTSALAACPRDEAPDVREFPPEQAPPLGVDTIGVPVDTITAPVVPPP